MTSLKWHKEEKRRSNLHSSLVGDQHLLSLLYPWVEETTVLGEESMGLPSALWTKEVFIQTLLQSKFRGGNIS